MAPQSSTLHRSIILDLDKSKSNWQISALVQGVGLIRLNAPFAAHHPKLFPPGTDRLTLADIEYSPPRPGAPHKTSKVEPLKTWPEINQELGLAAASALLCEFLLRSTIGPQEATPLLLLAETLLDHFASFRPHPALAAAYALHRTSRTLGFISTQTNCPICSAPLFQSPARFDPQSGEVSCNTHNVTQGHTIAWPPEKLALHLAASGADNFLEFETSTAPLLRRFGTGLAWAFLDDLIRHTQELVGPMKSWRFMQQLRTMR